ncbi:MAG TPA: hypothetical protein VLG37_04820 [Candidatus Saccharimonadales bacterium]|nr:hypothetical protein [Candidatus Saccharimonadales bacterium]
MTPVMTSLFIAAGVAAWIYSKSGRRMGYGNTQNVWIITGAAFVIVFIVIWTILRWVLHI